MKQKLQYFFCTLLVSFFLLTDLSIAQTAQVVSIRDLNTYDNLTSFDDIENHPLTGELVEFTAVVVSNPKTSGNASFQGVSEEFPLGRISRIHIFVADTDAISEGRDGMYLQTVTPIGNSAFFELEDLLRGDVVTLRGRLVFFNSTAQIEVEQVVENLGNVNEAGAGFEDLAPLLDPIEISPADIHNSVGTGVVQLDLDAYQRFNGQYVTINNATLTNIGEGANENRFEFRFNRDGSFVYFDDISHRFRNDRSDYRDGYNWRRPEDGDFTPPNVGSLVRGSGFLVISDFPTDDHFPDGEGTLRLSLYEDGILWLDDETRLAVGETPDFEWPIDFEVLASAPQVLDVSITPDQDIIDPSEQITVTAQVFPPEDGPSVTIDEVRAQVSLSDGTQQTIIMNFESGNTYSADLPAFDNFTFVDLFVEADGSNGTTGRFPVGGALSFFVSDGEPITTIEGIQRTDDDLRGPSPLANLDDVPMDITATVVSGGIDGPIIVHDASTPWSGIYLETVSETVTLQRGDVINITSAGVREADFSSSSFTGTFLIDVVFTSESSGNPTDDLIPVLTTGELNAITDVAEVYDGMLVRVENVELTSVEGFGEFEFASVEIDGETLEAPFLWNDDIALDGIPNPGNPNDLNIHLKLGNRLNAITGVMTNSFGDTKLVSRDLDDIEGDDFSIPRREFALLEPTDGALISVNSDLGVTWQALEPADYDGDSVTYEWVLYTPDADTTEVIAVTSDNEGSDAMVTLPFDVVDGLLEANGLSVGETIDLVWNVRVSDGVDTVAVASDFDFDTDQFETLFFDITLERNEATSIDDGEGLSGVPRTFELKQNYPNPFNPSTVIRYAVPEASNVRIDVYNVLGQRVSTLVNREHQAGNFDVTFDASNLSSGMYFYRLESSNAVLTQKMMLIK